MFLLLFQIQQQPMVGGYPSEDTGHVVKLVSYRVLTHIMRIDPTPRSSLRSSLRAFRVIPRRRGDLTDHLKIRDPF